MEFDPRQPYSLLLQICDSSCDYSFWREKARRSGFPNWFFDLLQPLPINGLRKVNGAYRYLELMARKDFPPETLAIYDKGELYGMYESFYGLWLAIYREDRPGIRFFYSHLDITGSNLFYVPQYLTKISPPSLGIKFFSEILGEKNAYIEEEASTSLSSEQLLSLLSRGDGRALEILLDRENKGKIGFLSILLSAAQAGSLIFATRLPLPPLRKEEKEELILSAASSGDYSTLDYYQRKTNIKLSSFSSLPLWVVRGVQRALLYRGDILSIYQVVREFPSSAMKDLSSFSFGLTTELALLILEKERTSYNYYNIIYYNLGNLALLLTLLPLAKDFSKACLEVAEQENYFPLAWNNLNELAC